MWVLRVCVVSKPTITTAAATTTTAAAAPTATATATAAIAAIQFNWTLRERTARMAVDCRRMHSLRCETDLLGYAARAAIQHRHASSAATCLAPQLTSCNARMTRRESVWWLAPSRSPKSFPRRMQDVHIKSRLAVPQKVSYATQKRFQQWLWLWRLHVQLIAKAFEVVFWNGRADQQHL